MKLLTIGQLSKLVGVRSSALRYYEQEGLLTSYSRSENGYRHYLPESEKTLRFIKRAQRLGFSLSNIRTLLAALEENSTPDSQVIIQTVDERYLVLERQVTETLVLRRELDIFLKDLHKKVKNQDNIPIKTIVKGLVERVCDNPLSHPSTSTDMLVWLINYTGCKLNSEEGQNILDSLQGQHFHIWKEDDAYNILVISRDPAVGAALSALAGIESSCNAHTQSIQAPGFVEDQEGYLLITRGENAFLFARLFINMDHNLPKNF
jgi:DNA-binding transcriptional MerR regulator